MNIEQWLLRVKKPKAEAEIQGPQAEAELVKEALSLFYQLNWTGPTMSAVEDDDVASLIIDGEWPYRLVCFPSLLAWALAHLHLVSECEWKLRGWLMHQLLLEHPSATLHAQLKGLEGQVDPLEMAMVHACYQEGEAGQKCLREAFARADFAWSLTGQLGRRTIHQATSFHQLVVVKRKEETPEPVHGHSEKHANCCKPNVVPLLDDHLLDAVNFDNEATSLPLTADQQALLLGQVQIWERGQAADAQVRENSMALLEACLGAGSQSWLIYTAALYHRARMQVDRPRLIERACLQIQALVEQASLAEPPASERIDWRMLGILPPLWLLDAEQGQLFAKLGVFKTAMAVFERRQLWPQTIRCMVQVGLEEAARDKLKLLCEQSHTDPCLWCLRGEVEKDPAHFERAWQVSGQRYAQAQRSLAAWHYGQNQWAQAVACFNTALAINALHPRCWLLLGMAHLQLGESRLAAVAFGRAVALDADLVDGWMLLAQAQRQEGRPREALNALREASRLDTMNSKASWSLMQVAMELGEMPEAIQAYRRFLQGHRREISVGNLLAESLHPDHPLSPLHNLVGVYERAVVAQAPIAMLTTMQRQLKLLITETMMGEYAGEPLFWQSIARLHAAGGEGLEAIEAWLSVIRLRLNRNLPIEACLEQAKSLSTQLDGLLADQIQAVERLVSTRAAEK